MPMQLHRWNYWKTKTSFSLSLKYAAILLLFCLSVLIVACSSGTGGSSTDLGNPQVTVTIQLGPNGSPTPPLPEYWCGAWATQTSPVYNTAVGVYAKFVHNVGQNPVGVGGASATATVSWADQSTSTYTATTTNDGLAVFSIPTGGRAADINTVTLIKVDFVAKDGTTCHVQEDRQAFFTLIVISPIASATMMPSPTASPAGIGGPAPTCTPLPIPHLKRTPTPGPNPPPSPTPRPGC